jgi:hypothetical protein
MLGGVPVRCRVLGLDKTQHQGKAIVSFLSPLRFSYSHRKNKNLECKKTRLQILVGSFVECDKFTLNVRKKTFCFAHSFSFERNIRTQFTACCSMPNTSVVEPDRVGPASFCRIRIGINSKHMHFFYSSCENFNMLPKVPKIFSHLPLTNEKHCKLALL